ncbi:MAG: hypothetical protein R3310_18130 [Candidatus Competibacteraceae bacterium]|nr:hypothetical protein [Candidatus Competibacteraceae bacterium]
MRCANCKRHLSLTHAYGRDIVCTQCGARLTVVNLNWLVAASVLLPLLVILLAIKVTNLPLLVVLAGTLAGCGYYALSHWVLRTRRRPEFVGLSVRDFKLD